MNTIEPSAVPAYRFYSAMSACITLAYATAPIPLSAADALERHANFFRIKNPPAMRPFVRSLLPLVTVLLLLLQVLPGSRRGSTVSSLCPLVLLCSDPIVR